jgi:hypothetical protein
MFGRYLAAGELFARHPQPRDGILGLEDGVYCEAHILCGERLAICPEAIGLQGESESPSLIDFLIVADQPRPGLSTDGGVEEDALEHQLLRPQVRTCLPIQGIQGIGETIADGDRIRCGECDRCQDQESKHDTE